MDKLRPVRWIACGAAVLAVGMAGAGQAASMALPTGRITYQIKSPMMNGTSILTWVDGGKKFRQEMKGVGGPAEKKMTLAAWVIADGTHFYVHQSNMGKQVFRQKMPKEGGPSPLTPFTGANAKAGKVVGKGTVIGKACEIRQVGPAKIWLWKGVPLKMESVGQQGPGMTMTATKFETAPQLSPSQFKVPAGYQVKDAPQGGQPGAGAPRNIPTPK